VAEDELLVASSELADAQAADVAEVMALWALGVVTTAAAPVVAKPTTADKAAVDNKVDTFSSSMLVPSSLSANAELTGAPGVVEFELALTTAASIRFKQLPLTWWRSSTWARLTTASLRSFLRRPPACRSAG